MAVILALVLSFLGNLEDSAKQGSVAKVSPRLPLVVSAWPDKTVVRPGEDLRVAFRVSNASDKPQTFEVLEVSTHLHWKTDNPNVCTYLWLASDDRIVPVTLRPGEAYEDHLFVKLKPTTAKTVSFKMGFSPHNEENTYWSDRLVLGIANGRPRTGQLPLSGALRAHQSAVICASSFERLRLGISKADADEVMQLSPGDYSSGLIAVQTGPKRGMRWNGTVEEWVNAMHRTTQGNICLGYLPSGWGLTTYVWANETAIIVLVFDSDDQLRGKYFNELTRKPEHAFDIVCRWSTH